MTWVKTTQRFWTPNGPVKHNIELLISWVLSMKSENNKVMSN